MTNAEKLRSYYDAINRRDDEGLVTHLDESCVLLDVAESLSFRGKQGARDEVRRWLDAMPDARIQVTNLVEAGDQVIAEYVGRGTHTAPLGSGASAIPPTGRKVELQLCDVVRFQQGRIIGIRNYYDFATIARQLGIGIPSALEQPVSRPEARPH